MKFLRGLLFAAAALASVAISSPTFAAQSVMCAPEQPGLALARRVVNPVTSNAYGLNGQGCAIMAQADVGYFLSQGFTAGPPFGPNILYTTGVLTGTTSVLVGNIPAGAYIQHIIVQNTTANAVTGGIGVGTTASGSDVVAPANLACGASCLTFVTDASLLKRIFSTTAAQPIYVSANGVSGAWNSANVTVTVVYGYF